MCGKDLPVFPIVMGMDPESFVCYSLVLSYFLICFSPDRTQYCPTDAVNVFSLKTLLVLFVHMSGEWLYVIMAGMGSIDILKWKRLEVLGDPFLFLAKLCLLLASVFVNGNIRLALDKEIRTFACPGRSWGNATCSAFL